MERGISSLFRRVFRGGRRPMTCMEVSEIIQEYLDGVLDSARSARLKAHLEDCRRCGLEADTYNRIKASLATPRGSVDETTLARLRAFGSRLANGEEPLDEVE